MMVVLIRESLIQERIRSISERSMETSKDQIIFILIYSLVFFTVLLLMLRSLLNKDIEAEKENAKNFRNMASTDSMTGVRNKHAYSEMEINLNKRIADNDIDMGFYTTRVRELDEVFPWDIIDIGVTKEYLKREWIKASKGEITRNCMVGCNGCGANIYGSGKFCITSNK